MPAMTIIEGRQDSGASFGSNSEAEANVGSPRLRIIEMARLGERDCRHLREDPPLYENCDRATVLACTLWAELRHAQQRINELEREADERVVRAEADTDERLGRVRAEIEAAFTRLEAELAEARQRAEGATAEAERIGREADEREADERIRTVEMDAETCFEQVRAGARDQVTRLEIELAEAKRRAERAEQWLVRIRQEIEGGLIPSFAPQRGRGPETQ